MREFLGFILAMGGLFLVEGIVCARLPDRVIRIIRWSGFLLSAGLIIVGGLRGGERDLLTFCGGMLALGSLFFRPLKDQKGWRLWSLSLFC